MWGQELNNLDGPAAVRDLQESRGIEVVFVRPDAPLTGDRVGRIDENTVEIEEDGGAAKQLCHQLSIGALSL